MSEARDYTPFAFAPTSVLALLAAPWAPALMLMLHGAYGVAPERTWFALSLLEVGALAALAFTLVFLSGWWGFDWLEGLADGAAVRLSAVALAIAQALVLADMAAQVPGALVGTIAAWGAVLMGVFGVMNALLWLPRAVVQPLVLAMSSTAGVVAGAWLGGVAAGLAFGAFWLLAFALLPLAVVAEPYLPVVVPPLLALLGGVVGGFLAVRLGRALLISFEDRLLSSGFVVLMLLLAALGAFLVFALVRAQGGVELLGEPVRLVATGAFAVGAVGSLGFTLARQARLRARFGRANVPAGA